MSRPWREPPEGVDAAGLPNICETGLTRGRRVAVCRDRAWGTLVRVRDNSISIVKVI